MHGWPKLWFYARTFGAVTALALAAYYGPRKMLETWDWYLDRFLDAKVRRALHQHRAPMKEISAGRFVRYGLGVDLADLATQCEISEESARARLQRLEKRGEAIDCRDDGWRAPDKYEG
jgi:hypothetical protein